MADDCEAVAAKIENKEFSKDLQGYIAYMKAVDELCE
jgi:hypothetical protein